VWFQRDLSPSRNSSPPVHLAQTIVVVVAGDDRLCSRSRGHLGLGNVALRYK